MWKFPLKNGKIKRWILGHCVLTFAVFTAIYWFTYNENLAVLSGLIYPIRAFVWKAPGRPGYDVNDPIEDYGWGAIVPFFFAILLMLIIKLV